MDEVGFILPRGGIVGVVGPNGAGETTLFRMIVGEEKPDAGTLRIGETVVLAYVDQSRETLVGERTVWEELSDGGRPLIMVGKREVNSRAYAAAFKGGGVGARVHLALADHDERAAAVGELLPHGALPDERFAALVDVGEDHRLADAERTGVGLLLAHDHAEERRLARAVRADHADDPAARQDEADVVHEEVLAVRLAHPLRLDH